MPVKLDEMERALIQQQEELKQLRQLIKDAQAARDNTRVCVGNNDTILVDEKSVGPLFMCRKSCP